MAQGLRETPLPSLVDEWVSGFAPQSWWHMQIAFLAGEHPIGVLLYKEICLTSSVVHPCWRRDPWAPVAFGVCQSYTGRFFVSRTGDVSLFVVRIMATQCGPILRVGRSQGVQVPQLPIHPPHVMLGSDVRSIHLTGLLAWESS